MMRQTHLAELASGPKRTQYGINNHFLYQLNNYKTAHAESHDDQDSKSLKGFVVLNIGVYCFSCSGSE